MSVDRDLLGLFRGSSINLAGALAAAALGFLQVALVTNSMDLGEAGVVFTVSAIFLLTLSLSELGSDTGLARFLPHHVVHRQPQHAGRTVHLALAATLAASLVVTLVLMLAADPIGNMLGGAGGDQLTDSLFAIAPFLPAACVFNATLAATRGYGTMRHTVLVDKLCRTVIQTAAVGASAYLIGTPVAVSVAWAAPYLVTLPLAIRAYLITRRSVWPNLAPRRDDRDEDLSPLTREFFGFTTPRAVARLCQVALQRVDIILLAAWSSPENAAIYTAATRFLVFGQFASLAVQQILQPTLSRLLSSDNKPAAVTVFRAATAWIMALVWPMYLATSILAPQYLALFGADYTSTGQSTVVLLALTMLVATACGPTDVVLLMAGRSLLSLVNNAAALLLNLALNALLIPSLGLSGAAIAWSAALLLRNLLPLLQVRSLGFSPFSPGVTWVAVGGAVFAMPLLVAAVALGGSGAALLGALGVSTLVYVSWLWRGRARLSLDQLTSLLARHRSVLPPAEKASTTS